MSGFKSLSGNHFIFDSLALVQDLVRLIVVNGLEKIIIAHHHRARAAAGQALGKLDAELAILGRLQSMRFWALELGSTLREMPLILF